MAASAAVRRVATHAQTARNRRDPTAPSKIATFTPLCWVVAFWHNFDAKVANVAGEAVHGHAAGFQHVWGTHSRWDPPPSARWSTRLSPPSTSASLTVSCRRDGALAGSCVGCCVGGCFVHSGCAALGSRTRFALGLAYCFVHGVVTRGRFSQSWDPPPFTLPAYMRYVILFAYIQQDVCFMYV